jgi:hypothetical protein
VLRSIEFDAFAHLKVIGYTAAAKALFEKAGIADDLDEGVIELDARASMGQYIEAAKQQRVWRASATGAVDFTGVEVESIEIVWREGRL